MENTFWQRWGWHITYWAVILAVVFMYEMKNRGRFSQEAALPMLESQKLISEIADGENNMVYNQIKLAADVKKSAWLDSTASNSRLILQNLRQNVDLSLSKLHQRMTPEFLSDFKKKDAEIIEQKLLWTRLALPQEVNKNGIFDRLLGTETTAEKKITCPFAESLQNASPDEAMARLMTLRANVSMLEYKIFDFIRRQNGDLRNWGHAFEILMKQQTQIAKAGQPFEAIFVIAPLTIEAPHLTFTVNGQEIARKQGGAFYETIFQQPGIQNLEVVAQGKNLSSGEDVSYKQTFMIDVK